MQNIALKLYLTHLGSTYNLKSYRTTLTTWRDPKCIKMVTSYDWKTCSL